MDNRLDFKKRKLDDNNNNNLKRSKSKNIKSEEDYGILILFIIIL